MTQKPTPPRNNDPATFAKELTPLYTLKGHKREVTSVGVSYGSRIIVSGSWDKTIKIWNGLDYTLLRTLDGHSEGVLSVALSPDAHTIASADYDSNVKIWNTLDSTVLRTLNQAGKTVAISPDGHCLRELF